ncbi:LysR family transcriptional regulator [Geomicrobium sp. JCM 19039]|uniref:LysR family transcriptional regulator n=1 Tax=Geomicrobium sp. JCM 19039 TaxID=1460636 RepID=UPI00187C581B|nr:LysR family transcriptional regulator [Geomicrobium sp. JCM 19039]
MENIEAYLYVAHFQNVHRAARALYLSQPSVTARIKSIEKELNVQLFTRKGRGIEITAQGAEFLPFAEQIFKTYQQGKNMMQKQEHSHEELVIGANGIATRFFLPYVLPIWRNQLDYIRIKTISGDNEDILNKLIKKEVDVAFVRGMEHPLVTSFTLLKNQIQLAVKQEHSLLRQSSISVDDLASEPMVFFECGAFDWSRIRKMFDVHHTRPPIDYHVDDLSVATKLISAGKGIAFFQNFVW